MLIKILREQGDFQHAQSDWNKLLLDNTKSITDIDFTASCDWTLSLWNTNYNSTEKFISLLMEGGKIQSILPLYKSVEKINHLKGITLSPLSELNSGRTGIITSEPADKIITQHIHCILDEINNWDMFKITLVAGSTSEKHVLDSMTQRGIPHDILIEKETPYIELEGDWDSYLQAMPKKLRWTMKNSEKKLREQGELTHRLFSLEAEADEFYNTVIEVEKESWKGSVGTAISGNEVQETFYRDFTPRAASQGWLMGHVLYLDKEPIAYMYGLIFGDVFHDIKESYKVEYRNLSPGHVLKKFVFQDLFIRNIKLYDFMGRCDDYKMRWTKQTYVRKTYVFYNKSMKGRIFYLRARVANAYNTVKKSLTKSHVPPVK